MIIDRQTVDDLALPAGTVGRRLGAVPPRPGPGLPSAWREDLLLLQLASDVAAGQVWLDLGQLLWEQAVAGRDEVRRHHAQRCLDLGRLLTWPWRQEPPLARYERMQWTRMGRPPRCQWQPESGPDDVRAGVLVFLDHPTGQAAWARDFRRGEAAALATADWPTASWLRLAMASASGDQEEVARVIEAAVRTAPERIASHLLDEAHRRAGRQLMGPALGRLRQELRLRRQAVASVWLTPGLPGALTALSESSTPRHVAEVTWENDLRHRQHTTHGTTHLAGLVRLAARHQAAGREPVRDGVRQAAEALPELDQMVIGLAAGERPVTADLAALVQSAAAMPARQRLTALATVAGALPDVAPAERGAAALALLEFTSRLAGRDAARMLLVTTVMQAVVGLPGEQLLPLVALARAGWSSSDEHDRIFRLLLEVLLTASEPGRAEAWGEADAVAADLDRVANRVAARLRLADAWLKLDPARAAALAQGAAETIRRELHASSASWLLRVKSASLLVQAGSPEGLPLLLDVAARLGSRFRRRREEWSAVACVGALAAAASREPDPSAATMADRLLSRIRLRPAQTVAATRAALTLAKSRPGRAARYLAVARQAAGPGCDWPDGLVPEGPVLAALLTLSEPLASPLVGAVLAATEQAVANGTELLPQQRADRLAGLARVVSDAGELAAVERWVAAQPRQPWSVWGLGFLADGLEHLAAERARASSELASRQLAAACRDRLRGGR